MLSKFLIAIVAFAAAVNAQNATTSSPAATPSLSTCVISCVGPAATSSGCGTFANLTCVCTSSAFQQAAAACLQANCTASDIQAAQTLQQAECAAISNTTSTGSTASSTSVASSTGSHASSSSTAPTATASAAASSLVANGLSAAIVAMVGGLLAIGVA